MGCSSYLYAPTNGMYASPRQMHLKFEEVRLNSEGKTLFGWHFQQTTFKQPKGFILFFHGNGQNRSSHFLALSWLLEKGYDYMIFDYQGYGESEGTPSPEGTVSDGVAALRWFFEEANREKIYEDVPLMVFAQSLGGAVALRSLQDYTKMTGYVPSPNLKWVVLDSTFLSYQKAGASVLSQHWLTYLFQPLSYVLLSDEWSPKASLERLPPGVQYIVMHGNEDTLIDYKLGQDLFAALPQPKQFVLVDKGRHINGFFTDGNKYRDQFLGMIEKTALTKSSH